MTFDPTSDSIAVTIPRFQLLRTAERGFRRRRAFNEPYIISLAIDEKGQCGMELIFNSMPFPNMREGDSVTMLGDGHIVYGPSNPGSYVAVSALFMESDSEIRNRGSLLQDAITAPEMSALRNAAVALNPTAGMVMSVLTPMAELVGRFMAANQDDYLARWDGVFLRDRPVPYQVNRMFTHENEFISTDIKVIPLKKANGQGAVPIVDQLSSKASSQVVVERERLPNLIPARA
jgi:hypothetical protein